MRAPPVAVAGMGSAIGPDGRPITYPILLFMTAEAPGENLTIFASPTAVAAGMDVWLARESVNATFDVRGQILTFDFRNDTATEWLGGRIKAGGVEYAIPRAAEEVDGAPRLRPLFVS
jgi:hypothetical protein